MRIVRVVFLMAALAVTFLTSPAAFAGKGDKPGAGNGFALLVHGPGKMASDWDIMCGGCGAPVDSTCSGDVDYCLGYCEALCGSPCGVCVKC
jgi:hypothetical protein